MTRSLAIGVASVAVALMACAGTPEPPPSPTRSAPPASPPAPPEAPPPAAPLPIAPGPFSLGQLSPETRKRLTVLMAVHRSSLRTMLGSIDARRYEEVTEAARAVAEAPPLDRNPELPPAFLDNHRLLRERARALAKAAEWGDPPATSQAYAELADVCNRCHEDLQPGRWGH